MEQLSSVPMGELLSMLEDKTVAAVAAQYFAKTHRKAVTLGVSLPKQSKTTSPQVSRGSTKPKTAGASKRPLNAFMAFRCMFCYHFCLDVLIPIANFQKPTTSNCSPIFSRRVLLVS